MHTAHRTIFATTAALAAVVATTFVLTLPPAPRQFSDGLPPTHIMGAYHVHSSRSDGTGDVDAIAASAARAGLQFLILTDHGDGTRPPDPPTYRHGVLTIDAVEVNTASGHVVALGLGDATPYPLAGPARDVVEDIHRLGGVAVMAHPDSPSPSLRWRGPATGVPFDGIEWLNVDSEWRDNGWLMLLGTSAHGVIRGPAAIASLFTRPARTLARWDAAAMRSSTFGLAALDAHANIPWRDREEPRASRGLAFPSYDTMFRALVQVALLDSPLTGEPAGDAARLHRAITTGRSYAVVRGIGSPTPVVFTAEQGGRRLTMGERTEAGTPLALSAEAPGVPGARLHIFRDGRSVSQGLGHVDYRADGSPGVYRLEVTLDQRAMPWVVTNPIVVARPDAPATEVATASGAVVPLAVAPSEWAIEREPSSSGAIAQDGHAVRFSYTLAPGPARGQYAALVRALPTDLGIDRIQFTARADRPMRLSVQVRTPDDRGGQRWRRSVYLDATPRTIVVPLEQFDPADVPTTRRPVVARLQSLLFVVDTLNSLTGTSGTIWVSAVALGTPSTAATSER